MLNRIRQRVRAIRTSIREDYTLFPPAIHFIHVGKCGGTSIIHQTNLKEIHVTRPISKKNVKFVIWIRNPIHRFVSAFNHSKGAINLSQSHTTPNLSIAECPVWWRVNNFIKGNTDTIFSKKYDQLIELFPTVNDLAESITSPEDERKANALALMSAEDEHIYRGLGWYLSNGSFLNENLDKFLMVGLLEENTQCLKKLQSLGVRLRNTDKVYRSDKTRLDRSLSPLAVQNIKNFYRDSDYRCVQIMESNGLIPQGTMQSYSVYSPS